MEYHLFIVIITNAANFCFENYWIRFIPLEIWHKSQVEWLWTDQKVELETLPWFHSNQLYSRFISPITNQKFCIWLSNPTEIKIISLGFKSFAYSNKAHSWSCNIITMYCNMTIGSKSDILKFNESEWYF